ncbi:50S ribosomal protein L11 methyltransferase [Gilvimarinus xylanilyticus]|uniref:Ribosomal protein L11 methyltransferase n=1 Tax=Gilvimarinus xylanilyticus TaxID=2944139 RepID=A0A9X2KRD7_9GAMM|nr:50S ribosomal protein L11 methyltransferase [Gilvimarinus xylanilyticus]MCP8897746.1 50S ribosomal protein L11 methyltransferase [Gilvimarinus xylanilyticus]
MPWLQLKLTTSRKQTEALEDAMLDNGACSVTLEDNADQPILEPGLGETPLWDEVKLTGLFEAEIDTRATTQAIAQSYAAPLPSHAWEQLEDKDWEREWMANYHPIRCGERLWICPSWCEPPEPDKVNILLDPGLAFGTGTHPTTFLCMQWLDQQDVASAEVIDYGCGSGILGIAALKLGAKHAVGVDIDPQALIATADNAARNHLADNAMPVFLPGDAPTQAADIVLANILAGPLAELAPALTELTRPGGRLCLSGILATQAQAVMDAYREHFDFDPIAQKDEWVRITGRKVR